MAHDFWSRSVNSYIHRCKCM